MKETREMMARMLVSMAVLTALGIGGAARAEHPRYRVTVIPDMPGSGERFMPRMLSDRGVACGYTVKSDGSGYTAATWTPGRAPVELSSPPGMGYSLGVEILNDGTIVGNAAPSIISEWQARGWYYRAGAYTLIPEPLPGRGNGISGVNELGVAVSTANDGTFAGTDAFRVAGGALQRLFAASAGSHSAADINDAGQIVGVSPQGPYRIEPDGSVTLLPLARADLTYSSPGSINERGDVLGSATGVLTPEQRFGWIYTDAGGTRLIDGPGRRDTPTSLNNRGVVVGGSEDTGGRGDLGWVWTAADGLAVLNDLLAAEPSRFRVYLGAGVNERGQIVALGFDMVEVRPVSMLLTPVAPVHSPAVAGPSPLTPGAMR